MKVALVKYEIKINVQLFSRELWREHRIKQILNNFKAQFYEPTRKIVITFCISEKPQEDKVRK